MVARHISRDWLFRLAPLISAIGMSIVLQNFVQISQGARVKPLPPQIQGLLDDLGIAVRVGHHCARPVCARFGDVADRVAKDLPDHRAADDAATVAEDGAATPVLVLANDAMPEPAHRRAVEVQRSSGGHVKR